MPENNGLESSPRSEEQKSEEEMPIVGDENEPAYNDMVDLSQFDLSERPRSTAPVRTNYFMMENKYWIAS